MAVRWQSDGTRSSRDALRRQSGITLIELIVVAAVVAIMAALLLSGIQFAREVVRRQQCQNNLRQIGLAVLSYESQFRAIPPALAETGSIHVALLPHLEQFDLYERVFAASHIGLDAIELEAAFVPTFLCSSDNAPESRNNIAGTNYAANMGVWALHNGFDGAFRPLGGMSSNWKYGSGPLGLQDFSDGTSATACFSELLRSDGSIHVRRVLWQATPTLSLPQFAANCQGAAGTSGISSKTARGFPWTNGNVGYTIYNHAMIPNSPSCAFQTSLVEAVSSAGSQHTRGVNVLYVDGHTAFVAETMNVAIWQKLGSRNDGG